MLFPTHLRSVRSPSRKRADAGSSALPSSRRPVFSIRACTRRAFSVDASGSRFSFPDLPFIVGLLDQNIANPSTDEPKGTAIVLVGESDWEMRGLRVLGRYRREELPTILEKERITVSFFPSVCPETFSYVTAELMELGMRIACFDRGAQAEQIRTYPLGTVIPEGSAKAALGALSDRYCRSTVLERELE